MFSICKHILIIAMSLQFFLYEIAIQKPVLSFTLEVDSVGWSV